MTTIWPKDPVVTERKSVILSDAERRNLRRKLKGSVAIATNALNPKTQWRRAVVSGKAKALRATEDVAQVARKNTPAIGFAGLGLLLVIARRPISEWIVRLGNATKTGQIETDRNDND